MELWLFPPDDLTPPKLAVWQHPEVTDGDQNTAMAMGAKAETDWQSKVHYLAFHIFSASFLWITVFIA